MRLMRSHNLAYFLWFLEHKKIPPAHRCTNGIQCYSGNIKCVLCDRMSYQSLFVLLVLSIPNKAL